MDLTEIWHYHRPALAKMYLDTLNAGLVTSITIFAPRRTGKTSFLLNDLKPTAESMGYIVAYADLWQTKLSPGLSIVRSLEQALEPATTLGNIIAKLNTPIKSIKGKAEIVGSKLEGEVELVDTSKKAQSLTALQIDALIETLCKKKPLLLLIDEAQELAKIKEHETVATALRTAITKNQRRLRVVFTGSSRTQLAHVFSNSNAPLYSTGSAITDFPLLDKDFVKYIAAQFKASTKRTLPLADAIKFFAAFKYQPEPFLVGIVDMVLHPSLTLEDAMKKVEDRLSHTENHEGVWSSLDEIQKVLVRVIAKNPTIKPFSKAVIAKMRAIIGIDSIEATHIQRAMTKLSMIIIKSPRDTYEFENEAFAQWARTLAD